MGAIRAQMHSTAYRNPAQPARWRSAGGRLRLLRNPDRRRASRSGTEGLPFGGAARASATGLSRARLLLVVGRSWKVGCGCPGGREGARDDCSERSAWRTQRSNFRLLATKGITLVGRTEACSSGVMRFAPDLVENLREGRRVICSPCWTKPTPTSHEMVSNCRKSRKRVVRCRMRTCVKNPILSLDLAGAGIATIIWATGFTTGLQLAQGRHLRREGRGPRHQRGVLGRVQGFIFWGCPGNRGEDPVSSGACGTTPSISRTRSRSSVTTSRITKQHPADDEALLSRE